MELIYFFKKLNYFSIVLNIYYIMSKSQENNKNIIFIEYDIPLINYNGILSGDIKNITTNFINALKSIIVSKHLDCSYYIQKDMDNNIPSPFSNSNTINNIIPGIIYDFVEKNKSKYIFKIRFISNSKNINFFDTKENPTYDINLIKLN